MNPGHGLRGYNLITAGWEFHPTPKETYLITNYHNIRSLYFKIKNIKFVKFLPIIDILVSKAEVALVACILKKVSKYTNYQYFIILISILIKTHIRGICIPKMFPPL